MYCEIEIICKKESGRTVFVIEYVLPSGYHRLNVARQLVTFKPNNRQESMSCCIKQITWHFNLAECIEVCCLHFKLTWSARNPGFFEERQRGHRIVMISLAKRRKKFMVSWLGAPETFWTSKRFSMLFRGIYLTNLLLAKYYLAKKVKMIIFFKEKLCKNKSGSRMGVGEGQRYHPFSLSIWTHTLDSGDRCLHCRSRLAGGGV